MLTRGLFGTLLCCAVDDTDVRLEPMNEEVPEPRPVAIVPARAATAGDICMKKGDSERQDTLLSSEDSTGRPASNVLPIEASLRGAVALMLVGVVAEGCEEESMGGAGAGTTVGCDVLCGASAMDRGGLSAVVVGMGWDDTLGLIIFFGWNMAAGFAVEVARATITRRERVQGAASDRVSGLLRAQSGAEK